MQILQENVLIVTRLMASLWVLINNVTVNQPNLLIKVAKNQNVLTVIFLVKLVQRQINV